MDALSSQASLAGYKAVLMAANRLGKFFPMLMTAAGTIAPARVLVLGAGVAGLQAIATARRLGAIVEAYDVRPAVKEEVQSLGAKFVELPLEAQEGQGGYASAQSEEFLKKQRELLAERVGAADVVITTAAVPGRKAPVLVTADMVRAPADVATHATSTATSALAAANLVIRSPFGRPKVLTRPSSAPSRPSDSSKGGPTFDVDRTYPAFRTAATSLAEPKRTGSSAGSPVSASAAATASRASSSVRGAC